MGNLVPSLPQFAKASFGMPGTLFRKMAGTIVKDRVLSCLQRSHGFYYSFIQTNAIPRK